MMEGIETIATSNPSSPQPTSTSAPPPTVAPATSAPSTSAPSTSAPPATSAPATSVPATGITNVPCANVVTIPVPVAVPEETYAYITVKGSLHDRSCAAFGLNDAEIQALSKRFDNGVKQVVNGVQVPVSPLILLNSMAQLGYKVVCSCGEAEICWTMQREI